jgi:hypothetical protein
MHHRKNRLQITRKSISACQHFSPPAEELISGQAEMLKCSGLTPRMSHAMMKP